MDSRIELKHELKGKIIPGLFSTVPGIFSDCPCGEHHEDVRVGHHRARNEVYLGRVHWSLSDCG